ncbi:hypothetical protein P692DRAFT_201868342 [Suillus brevipes Sb2]|nr:hypothetical protein P692DRAFT_201868342 [Suillus brevipes Sb2]
MEKNTVIDNTSNTDTAGNVVHMNIFGAVSPDTAYAVRFTPQSLEEQTLVVRIFGLIQADTPENEADTTVVAEQDGSSQKDLPEVVANIYHAEEVRVLIVCNHPSLWDSKGRRTNVPRAVSSAEGKEGV